MFAVLTRTEVVNKGLFSMLFSDTVGIKAFKTAIQIESRSFQMAYCFPVCENFTISVSLKHAVQEKRLDFKEGKETITFMFDQLSITLDFALHLSIWDFYEHAFATTSASGNTVTKMDICINAAGVGAVESQGMYNGRRYFINQNTLETSFSGMFPSLQKLPSFSRVMHKSKVFYTDSINKIVVGMSPSMKKSIVKNKIKGYLSNRKIPKKLVRVRINRSDLIRSSFKSFLPIICIFDILSMIVVFENEIGEDHGAIRREYIYLLFQELVKDRRLTNINGVLDITPGSYFEFLYEYSIGSSGMGQTNSILEDVLSDADFLDDRVYYILLGAAIGSTFLLRETFQANFSLGFYENLLNRKFTLRHIQDTELQGNLLKNLRNSSLYLGSKADEIIKATLFESKIGPYSFIKFGFDCVVKKKLDSFTAFDFPFIFYHFEPISLGKLRDLAVYDKCTVHTKEIVWFWEIMEDKQQQFVSKLLLFVTGSGNLGVFDEDSTIYFEKTKSHNELFKASSCSKRLYVPCFETRERMEYFLDYSILNTEGFHKI